MLQLTATFFLLAAVSVAVAQDKLVPGSVVTCPLGTVPIIDGDTGARICISTSQKPLQQGYDTLKLSPKPKRKRFEVSKRCPGCK